MTPEQTKKAGIIVLHTSISVKQDEILKVIAKGNSDGSLVDIHQVVSRCTLTASHQGVAFTIRYMTAQGRIKKAGLHKRKTNSGFQKKMTYKVTDVGLHLLSGLGETDFATQNMLSL